MNNHVFMAYGAERDKKCTVQLAAHGTMAMAHLADRFREFVTNGATLA